MTRLFLAPSVVVFLLWGAFAHGQGLEVPRAQDRPPGPPRSPEEAVAKMTVPDGFNVEIVAAEPDVVNPVAMAIDEKGRYWITESFEYPRREPGPGKDRIKVLEDTNGDGKVDKVTVFAEGLNIPSGIAVGHGGVWVANSPDILFMQDTDGDLKADKQEVIVTGFGRDDTHELPNSFTWGPDGWLYGLNGVFNYCDVKYGEANPNYNADHPGWKFTCALFRIQPRTRKFEIFAEGTSNPWGVAINENGDFFLSACVIDHLWHIADNGYYIRQGGPYPPHTWPIESIVEHKHQKAAYCGITWFDSPAYPDQYRKVLYMGNIHGGCINADVLERNGSTYKGKAHSGFTAKPGAWDHDDYNEIRKTGDRNNPKLADLLNANDPWFMPVVQKTGPDGSLYILDWYDRYHCYQDANADPAGIERAKGRLYRLRYRETRRVKPFDLAKKSDDELIELLGDANVFYRETAQRLLNERNTPVIYDKLVKLTTDKSAKLDNKLRHATFALMGFDLTHPDRWTRVAPALFECEDEFRRVWAVRCLRNSAIDPQADEALQSHAAGIVFSAIDSDPSPAVRVQGVIYVARLTQVMQSYVAFDDSLCKVLADFGYDPLIPHAVWNALQSYTDKHPSQIAVEKFVTAPGVLDGEGGQEVARRLLYRTADQRKFDLTRRVLSAMIRQKGVGQTIASQSIWSMSANVASGAIRGDDREALQKELAPLLEEILKVEEAAPLRAGTTNLAAAWGDADAIARVTERLEKTSDDGLALDHLRALISGGDDSALDWATRMLKNPAADFQGQVLFLMGRMDDPKIADAVLAAFPTFSPELQPKALELLTQRPQWSAPLLAAVAAKSINKDLLNLNQLRRVASFKDEDVQKQFKDIYGVIREGRNPDREQVMRQTRDFLHGSPGDPHAGEAVFKKVCAQCHKMYGEGNEVGPDITSSGRNNWDQLVSNVLDPSLVIGNAYQARILATADGRVLTGLPVEETDQRVVLKVQGGKLETIPRDEIDQYKVSELSMMPEQLEKQITSQEMADLFAFLVLDKHPSDKSAKILPGAPRQKAK
jgi:putative membrane-bound dehydrogenase-like protein